MNFHENTQKGTYFDILHSFCPNNSPDISFRSLHSCVLGVSLYLTDLHIKN